MHLSGYGKVVRVGASGRLSLTHVGRLRSVGVNSYRLIAGPGSTLTLQRLLAHHAQLEHHRTGLPDGSAFHRPHGWSIRLYRPNRSSTWYRARCGSIAMTAEAGGVRRQPARPRPLHRRRRLRRDPHVLGPGRRPGAGRWRPAPTPATRSQHHAGGTSDICDTTSCQVYGGRAALDRAGHVLDQYYWPAAAATSRKVLLYRGQAIFAQFSASNGGWMSSGGQPYLAAGADRYDAAASGDPYLDRVDRVRVSSIAHYFGLAQVSRVAVTRRDARRGLGRPGRLRLGPGHRPRRPNEARRRLRRRPAGLLRLARHHAVPDLRRVTRRAVWHTRAARATGGA